MRKSLLAALIGIAMVSTLLPVTSGPVQFGHAWGTYLGESASAVEVDSSGNVYLAGSTTYEQGDTAKGFVVKTNIVGELIWDLYLSSPTMHFGVTDTALAPDGGLFVASSYRTVQGNEYGSYYAKIDPSGSLVFQGLLPDLDSPNRVCADRSGNGFMIVGDETYYGQGTVVAIGADGAVRYALNATSSDEESPWAVTTDPSGASYVFLDSVYDSNVALAKFDGSGNLIRQVTLQTEGPNYEYTWDLVIGADGNVYALGANYGVGSLLMASFTPGLDLIWDEYVGTPTEGYEATRLVQVADGSLYAVGYTTFTSDGTSGPAVFKFDTSGALLESSYFGWDPTTGLQNMNDAAAYPNGGIVVAGESMGVPQNIPVGISNVLVTAIPESWTEDDTVWTGVSMSSMPGDIVVLDVDGMMDNFDPDQDRQAWFGVIDPPLPSFDVTITKRIDTATSTVSFRGRASGGDNPYTYTWYFGDGSTGSGARVSHTYPTGGIFTAWLMVMDNSGQLSYASTEVVLPAWPVINSLVYSPMPAYEGDSIQFTIDAYDPDGGDIVNYLWDFGDNATNSTTVPYATHSYASEGYYSVWAQATDDEGSTSGMIITVEVLALNEAPLPRFTYSPANPVVGDMVTFDASSSSDDGWIVNYLWSFGDSSNASGAVTNHVYSSEGTYSVMLAVTDNMGLTSYGQQFVTVEPGSQGNIVLYETFDSWSSIDPGWYVWNYTSPYNFIDVRNGVMYMSNYQDMPVDDSHNARAYWVSLVQYNETLRVDYQIYLPLGSYEKYGYWGQWVLFDMFASMDNQSDYNWASITTRFLMDDWSGAVNGWSYVGSDNLAHKITDFQAGWHNVSVEMQRGATTWTAGFDGALYPGLSFRTPGQTGFEVSEILFMNSLREEVEVAEVDNLLVQTGQGVPPPEASFAYTVSGATVNVDASGSSSSVGIASYTWDWGDGSDPEVSASPYSSHTYGPRISSAFAATDEVRDPPPPPFNVFGYVFDMNGSMVMNCPVTITDLRTGESVVTVTDSVYGYYMYDLNLLTYGWLDGDVIRVTADDGVFSGTNEGMVDVEMSYLWLDVTMTDAGGIDYYTVTLTVTDMLGLTGTASQRIGVVVPPVTADAYEPDDDFLSATILDFNTSQVHSIHDGGADVDWYVFTVPTSTEVVLETWGTSGDTMLYLFDQNGVPSTPITYDDDSGVGDFSKIVINSSWAGTYYAKVTESGTDSEIASYTMRLGEAAAAAQWTFMVYLDADNNLEEVGLTDFLEMSSVGSTSDVNIVVQMDRGPWYPDTYGNWTGTKRFLVTPGMTPVASNAVMDLGELNMGSQETLKDFITWSATAYPAERYMLVLWDHGGGWDGAVCVDDTDMDILTLDEVEFALSGNMNETGQWIDVLGFDACLMGMVEVSYELNEWTSMMIASEETIPWDGWPYDTIMADLVSDPLMSLDSLGSMVVQRYMEYYGSGGYETMSAIDIAAAMDLYYAVDLFSLGLVDLMNSNITTIDNAFASTDWYSYVDYLDLGDFASTLASMLPEYWVKWTALNVTYALDLAVVAEQHGNGHSDASGVSIYFPAWGYIAGYDLLDFAADTGWDDFVKAYASGTSFDDSYEPDDYYTEANQISFGETQTHSIGDGGTDVDWVTFTVYNSTDVTIRTSGPPGGYGDSVLYLYDSYGVPDASLAYSDDYNGLWSQITYSVSSGTYYVKVGAFGQGSPIPEYYLSLSTGGGGNQPPVACAHVIPNPAIAGEIAMFESSYSYDPDGYIVDWYWEFGDGYSAWGSTVYHVYAGVGDYWNHLTVWDNEGASSTEILLVEVVGGASPDAYEPDDTYDNASLLTSYMIQTHSIHNGGADMDWMMFTLTETWDVKIDVMMSQTWYYGVNMSLFSSASVPDHPIAIADWLNQSGYVVIQCVLSPGLYYIRITPSWGVYEVAEYDIMMTLYQPTVGDGYEPDDTYLDANEIGMMSTQTHSILKEGRDVDWMKFTLTEATDVGIRTSGPLDQWTDTVLYLFGSDGVPYNFIDWNDDITNDLWSMIKASLQPGTYYVLVHAYDFGDPIPVYWIELNYSANMNMPPYAYFNIDPWNPSVGTDIVFDGSASNDSDGYIVSWSWDFGDGTSGAGAVFNHSYGAVGSYNVTLTVTDDDGATGSYFIGLWITDNYAPVVDLYYYPSNPDMYQWVYFNGYAYDPDGYVTSYQWNVDGAITSSYSSYLSTYFTTPGEHHVTLTAFDNSGLSGSASVIVSINQPPVAVIDVSPDIGKVGGVCTFDASGSYDPDGDTLYFDWDFGDGLNHTGQIVEHVFYEVGVFEVYLYLHDEHGSWAYASISYTVVMPVPPVAIISYSPVRPAVGELATFDAYASLDPDGSIVTYIWQFGDGVVAYGQIVTHAYAHPGTYTVKLTVVDDDNLVDDDAGTITVVSAPVANFEHMPLNPSVGQVVNFFAYGSSDENGIVEYVWDFGDGYYGYGWQVAHTFESSGAYIVTLTVKNTYGISASTSDTLTVSPTSPVTITAPDLTSDGPGPIDAPEARASSSASANSLVGGLVDGSLLLVLGLAALACGAARVRTRR